MSRILIANAQCRRLVLFILPILLFNFANSVEIPWKLISLITSLPPLINWQESLYKSVPWLDELCLPRMSSKMDPTALLLIIRLTLWWSWPVDFHIYLPVQFLYFISWGCWSDRPTQGLTLGISSSHHRVNLHGPPSISRCILRARPNYHRVGGWPFTRCVVDRARM